MQPTPIKTLQDFYEQHPYPPPIEDLTRYADTWKDADRRRAESFLFWPFDPPRDDIRILVAGCGTSQAAKYALRWPSARVVGIDLSDTSITRSEALKARHGLDNLTLHRMPIEDVVDLGLQFDLIVSTGVLHHLPDPETGLRALARCLKPGGAMHLMVYAPYGRAGIYMLQQYCRTIGLGTSPQDIAQLMQSLQALPPNHPIVPLLKEAVDFRDPSAIADALLHPQDRPFSVPELFSFIEACGLAFGRWLHQAPYLPVCGGITQIPHLDRLCALPLAQQFSAMELFRGNMLRHSAILYAASDTHHPGVLDFDSDGWMDYIPVRRARTISVEERLPPDTAAVLINQAHTQTDIYLPIKTPQKRMFERIDNRSSIADLTRQQMDPEAVRIFIKRLWWYDQIVIDASKAGRND